MIIGTWCVIPSPEVTRIICSTGINFVILDMEHGAFNIETVINCINAAKMCNCNVFVRVNNTKDVCRILDSGASGIVFSHIDSFIDGQKALESMYYKPRGDRSYSPYTYSGSYGTRKINHDFESVFIVESINGLKNLDDILTLDVDIIYIGQYDLSQEFNKHGDLNDKDVVSTLEDNVKKIIGAGKSVGAIAHTKKEISHLKSIGVSFIVYYVDNALLYNSYKDILEEKI